MQKNVNPWTGKTKTSRSVGMLNDIIYKYYPQFERPPLPNPYLEYIPIIEAQQNSKDIEEYRAIFDVKTKISKMEQILEWIAKVEHQKSNKKIQEEVPINSSFVYIPVHSYNTFHEILRQCTGLAKEPILKEQTVNALKRQIKEMEQILTFNQLLMDNVL